MATMSLMWKNAKGETAIQDENQIVDIFSQTLRLLDRYPTPRLGFVSKHNKWYRQIEQHCNTLAGIQRYFLLSVAPSPFQRFLATFFIAVCFLESVRCRSTACCFTGLTFSTLLVLMSLVTTITVLVSTAGDKYVIEIVNYAKHIKVLLKELNDRLNNTRRTFKIIAGPNLLETISAFDEMVIESKWNSLLLLWYHCCLSWYDSFGVVFAVQISIMLKVFECREFPEFLEIISWTVIIILAVIQDRKLKTAHKEINLNIIKSKTQEMFQWFQDKWQLRYLLENWGFFKIDLLKFFDCESGVLKNTTVPSTLSAVSIAVSVANGLQYGIRERTLNEVVRYLFFNKIDNQNVIQKKKERFRKPFKSNHSSSFQNVFLQTITGSLDELYYSGIDSKLSSCKQLLDQFENYIAEQRIKCSIPSESIQEENISKHGNSKLLYATSTTQIEGSSNKENIDNMADSKDKNKVKLNNESKEKIEEIHSNATNFTDRRVEYFKSHKFLLPEKVVSGSFTSKRDSFNQQFLNNGEVLKLSSENEESLKEFQNKNTFLIHDNSFNSESDRNDKERFIQKPTLDDLAENRKCCHFIWEKSIKTPKDNNRDVSSSKIELLKKVPPPINGENIKNTIKNDSGNEDNKIYIEQNKNLDLNEFLVIRNFIHIEIERYLKELCNKKTISVHQNGANTEYFHVDPNCKKLETETPVANDGIKGEESLGYFSLGADFETAESNYVDLTNVNQKNKIKTDLPQTKQRNKMCPSATIRKKDSCSTDRNLKIERGFLTSNAEGISNLSNVNEFSSFYQNVNLVEINLAQLNSDVCNSESNVFFSENNENQEANANSVELTPSMGEEAHAVQSSDTEQIFNAHFGEELRKAFQETLGAIELPCQSIELPVHTYAWEENNAHLSCHPGISKDRSNCRFKTKIRRILKRGGLNYQKNYDDTTDKELAFFSSSEKISSGVPINQGNKSSIFSYSDRPKQSMESPMLGVTRKRRYMKYCSASSEDEESTKKVGKSLASCHFLKVSKTRDFSIFNRANRTSQENSKLMGPRSQSLNYLQEQKIAGIKQGDSIDWGSYRSRCINASLNSEDDSNSYKRDEIDYTPGHVSKPKPNLLMSFKARNTKYFSDMGTPTTNGGEVHREIPLVPASQINTSYPTLSDYEQSGECTETTPKNSNLNKTTQSKTGESNYGRRASSNDEIYQSESNPSTDGENEEIRFSDNDEYEACSSNQESTEPEYSKNNSRKTGVKSASSSNFVNQKRFHKRSPKRVSDRSGNLSSCSNYSKRNSRCDDKNYYQNTSKSACTTGPHQLSDSERSESELCHDLKESDSTIKSSTDEPILSPENSLLITITQNQITPETVNEADLCKNKNNGIIHFSKKDKNTVHGYSESNNQSGLKNSNNGLYLKEDEDSYSVVWEIQEQQTVKKYLNGASKRHKPTSSKKMLSPKSSLSCDTSINIQDFESSASSIKKESISSPHLNVSSLSKSSKGTSTLTARESELKLMAKKKYPSFPGSLNDNDTISTLYEEKINPAIFSPTNGIPKTVKHKIEFIVDKNQEMPICSSLPCVTQASFSSENNHRFSTFKHDESIIIVKRDKHSLLQDFQTENQKHQDGCKDTKSTTAPIVDDSEGEPCETIEQDVAATLETEEPIVAAENLEQNLKDNLQTKTNRNYTRWNSNLILKENLASNSQSKDHVADNHETTREYNHSLSEISETGQAVEESLGYYLNFRNIQLQVFDNSSHITLKLICDGEGEDEILGGQVFQTEHNENECEFLVENSNTFLEGSCTNIDLPLRLGVGGSKMTSESIYEQTFDEKPQRFTSHEFLPVFNPPDNQNFNSFEKRQSNTEESTNSMNNETTDDRIDSVDTQEQSKSYSYLKNVPPSNTKIEEPEIHKKKSANKPSVSNSIRNGGSCSSLTYTLSEQSEVSDVTVNSNDDPKIKMRHTQPLITTRKNMHNGNDGLMSTTSGTEKSQSTTKEIYSRSDGNQTTHVETSNHSDSNSSSVASDGSSQVRKDGEIKETQSLPEEMTSCSNRILSVASNNSECSSTHSGHSKTDECHIADNLNLQKDGYYEEEVNQNCLDIDKDFHFETGNVKLDFTPTPTSGTLEINYRKSSRRSRLIFKSNDKKLLLKTKNS